MLIPHPVRFLFCEHQLWDVFNILLRHWLQWFFCHCLIGRFGNFLVDQIHRRRPVRGFADSLKQLVFVIRVNRQRLLEPAGRYIKLFAASRPERFGTFGLENAVHALALRTVRREAIAVRQISVIL